MRQIIIIFKQEDKELVACTADFGNRDEASELRKQAGRCEQSFDHDRTKTTSCRPGWRRIWDYGTRSGTFSKTGRTIFSVAIRRQSKKSRRELKFQPLRIRWLLGFYLTTQSSSVPIVYPDAMRSVLFTI